MPGLHSTFRSVSRLATIVLAMLAICAGLVVPAAAAPPANDNFANAINIASLPGRLQGNNLDSTYEPGEPSAGTLNNGTTVWWRYTAARSGIHVAKLNGTNFDAHVEVYTGSVVGSLSEVLVDGDGRFNMAAGTTYRIRVRGHQLAQGTIRLWLMGPSPFNDAFSNATVINGFGSVIGSNVGASFQTGEPVTSTSVWWRFTPTISGPVAINTFGSNFDTGLYVYTGATVGGLTLVASNADFAGKQSQVSFNAIAGTAYSIAVIGWGFEEGKIELTIVRGGAAGAANVVAAVTPVARAELVGQVVTAFATMLNPAAVPATGCRPTVPPGTPAAFSYYAYDAVTTLISPRDAPVNIRAGARQDFLLEFKPGTAATTDIALIFDCTNTEPAPSYRGVNTFLLTGVNGTKPADIITIAATTTGDGIMNVPLNGTGVVALAARNIGTAAALQLHLTPNPIGPAAPPLPGTITVCPTNQNGICLSPPAAPPLGILVGSGQTMTFSAFFKSNGTAIPFNPANRRLFLHFFQGLLPVGSTSVAVRTQ